MSLIFCTVPSCSTYDTIQEFNQTQLNLAHVAKKYKKEQTKTNKQT